MPLDDDDDFSAARAARRAGTSFYWAMRLLSRPRREAMFALYAWCRELDDIADEEAPPHDKLARLADWREEIERLFAGRPRAAVARALAGPIKGFTLPRAEFVRVIDGMEMDARGEMVAPDLDALRG
ncbi:MAG: squalene/phytoene synthase family protein, partial [Alphaproteobacteria bacterium]|nr:squalene/phytoene synthase family protein [Alphaproteobacteria bacterium]